MCLYTFGYSPDELSTALRMYPLTRSMDSLSIVHSHSLPQPYMLMYYFWLMTASRPLTVRTQSDD